MQRRSARNQERVAANEPPVVPEQQEEQDEQEPRWDRPQRRHGPVIEEQPNPNRLSLFQLFRFIVVVTATGIATSYYPVVFTVFCGCIVFLVIEVILWMKFPDSQYKITTVVGAAGKRASSGWASLGELLGFLVDWIGIADSIWRFIRRYLPVDIIRNVALELIRVFWILATSWVHLFLGFFKAIMKSRSPVLSLLTTFLLMVSLGFWLKLVLWDCSAQLTDEQQTGLYGKLRLGYCGFKQFHQRTWGSFWPTVFRQYSVQ